MGFRRIFSCLFVLVLLLSSALGLSAENARTLLEEYYIDPLPESIYHAETVDEVLSTLGDPFTDYLNAAEYEEFLASMRDSKRVGIGIRYHLVDTGLSIDRVFAGSAADGNLHVGDVILAADGASTAGLSTAEAVARLSGAEGAGIVLLVLCDGKEQTVMLTRAPFVVATASAELINGEIGYLECLTFGPDTYASIKAGVMEYDHAVSRWIVDLRGNGGGEIQAAADAAGLFARRSDMFFVRDGDGTYYRYASNADYTTMKPVIVLTDGMTASAAELFAASLRDCTKGIIIGSRTVGKGVAQIIIDGDEEPELFPDGDAIKITTYRNFSAGRNTTDGIGVIPNLILPTEYVLPAAQLLAAPAPTESSEGYLRLHLGVWRWYIRLETAQSTAYYPAFCALLSALPPQTAVFYGNHGDDNWTQITPEEAAEQSGAAYLPVRFSDVDGSPYADAIHTLAALGILSGNERGEFMPEQTLTRAELAAMFVKLIGAPPGTEAVNEFTDVPDDAWYAPYVLQLARQGLMQGYDGRFSPEETVTHEQFMVLFSRTAARLNMYLHAALAGGLPAEEADPYAGYSAWARELVWLCDGLYFDAAVNIDPTAPQTRGEAAINLYHLLYSLGYQK